MSSGELLLTAIVALFVFGPAKLPMLACHLAKLMRLLTHYQQQLDNFWQQQLKEHQLNENIKKAEQAEAKMQADTNEHHEK